jgi:hypothetical protein
LKVKTPEKPGQEKSKAPPFARRERWGTLPPLRRSLDLRAGNDELRKLLRGSVKLLLYRFGASQLWVVHPKPFIPGKERDTLGFIVISIAPENARHIIATSSQLSDHLRRISSFAMGGQYANVSLFKEFCEVAIDRPVFGCFFLVTAI